MPTVSIQVNPTQMDGDGVMPGVTTYDAVDSATITNGAIVNADINAAAGITEGKLAIASGKILIGTAGGVGAAQTMSGDATLAAGGALTIANSAVETVMINADAVDGTKIADDAVSLEHLDAAITPSHIVKFAGISTVEEDADASVVITVTGALETDVASAVLRASTADVYVKKAVLTADTLTVTLSGNGGAGTQVDYVVYRAAA